MPKPRKYAAADFWMLTCAIVMLLAFLALPWLVSATGMRIMGGTQNIPQGIRTNTLLPIVPAAAGAGLILTLMGIFAPRRKRLFAWLAALAGAAGLAYFVVFFLENRANVGAAMLFVGTGFWLALIGSIGLVVQVTAARPHTNGGALQAAQAGGRTGPRLSGCLMLPFRLLGRQIGALLMVGALFFGLAAGCAILVPTTFQAILSAVRSAGLQSYVRVLEITGNPALKVITYEATITTTVSIQRDMGLLGAIFGEGAQVTGTVRIGMGADIKGEQTGILTCEIDTDTLKTFVGRAPLAGTAFDAGAIEREAYKAFRETSAREAIQKFWPQARQRLQDNFIVWGLGFPVPETPTLSVCPSEVGR